MTQTQSKATRGSELVARLTAIGGAQVLDEVSLRQVAREAESLMSADAVAAHTVLGGIASLKRDTESVHDHYKVALKLAGRSTESLSNYAASLGEAGQMNEAFEKIVEAHERSPDDLEVLEAAISMAVQSASFRKSLDLYQRWNRLCPDRLMKDEASMARGAEAVERGAFSEDGAQQIVRLGHQVRSDGNARHAGTRMLALREQADTFLYELHVHASHERAAELGEEFADRIVCDDDLMADAGKRLVVVFFGRTPLCR